ncbi:hypothetical protein [Microbacterium sp. NPDC087665]|uniref:DUF7507 domain-containing protein n=1 Tax=Microbacterium sp. NPDC087665 TaxID=3364194 RepID=UPI00382F0172
MLSTLSFTRRTSFALIAVIAGATSLGVGAVVAGAASTAAADEGPGCTLSGYHAVAGDLVPAASRYATIAYQAATRAVDPANANFHQVGQSSTVVNRAAAHTFYETRWLLGHAVAQRATSAEYYATTLNGSGTFVSNAIPQAADWHPRANDFITFTPTTNPTSALGSMVYGDVSGVPASGTLVGLAVSVDPTAAVPAYDLGSIPVGGAAPVRVTAKLDRPINNGSYGWATTDLVAARTCLPDPTVNSWISGDALTPVTGTGDYAGDLITITDSNGAVVGTTAVGSDLSWTFTPTEPFAAGITTLTATETDEFGLTGDGPAGTVHVVTPSIAVAKLTNATDVTAAPGPQLVAGGPVVWTYDVTNTGDTYLDVTAADIGSDDAPITVLCPSSAAALAPAASVRCSATGTAVTGPYSNTVTVIGIPESELGEPIPGTVAVTSADQSWYTGVAAGPVTPPSGENPAPGAPHAEGPAVEGAEAQPLAQTGGTIAWTAAAGGSLLLSVGLALTLLRRRQGRSRA